MTIRTRLRLSYIAMMLISIALIISLNYFVNIKVFESSEEGLLSANPYTAIRNISVAREQISRRINIAELEMTEKKNSKEAIKFLKSFESDLAKIDCGILIRSEGDIIYTSETIENSMGKIYLPKFKEPFSKDNFFKENGRYTLLSQYDFLLDGKSESSMFVILDKSSMSSGISEIHTKLSIIITFAILLTSGIISYFMYMSIAPPLQRLKEASNEIKNGNLDFSVGPFSEDEIGDLAIAFEEMRKRLDDSIKMQAKYEENRQNMISNISHDLKTPIMSIKGHIEGIRDGIANSPEKLEKYMDIVYKKASEMELMIDEVFTFSKLDLGKVSFNFKNIDMCNYLEFCVEDLSLVVEKMKGTLELSCPCKEAIVVADPEKLKRVFTNIISNALKYMDKKNPEIKITLEDYKDMVKIGIHDNGRGIPDEYLPFIFDRFYRADESRNTNIPGSGLGLAISKQIINAHGGNIWAKSEYTKGTSIYFTLRKELEDEHIE